MAADKESSSVSDLDPWRVAAAFVPGLRIAHQIAGRVRLKLDADAASLRAIDAARLRQSLGALRGVQFNWLARSCVVEYDTRIIADAAWSDLLAGRRTAAAAVLLDLLPTHHATPRKEKTP